MSFTKDFDDFLTEFLSKDGIAEYAPIDWKINFYPGEYRTSNVKKNGVSYSDKTICENTNCDNVKKEDGQMDKKIEEKPKNFGKNFGYYNSYFKNWQKTDNGYKTNINVTGINPDDIVVELNEHDSESMITISGKTVEDNFDYSINTSIRLPSRISLKDVTYTIKNGICTIFLDEYKPEKKTIKVTRI